MKLIIAMIQENRQEAVRTALESTETPLIFASEVLDLRDGTDEVFRGGHYKSPKMKVRLEVLVVNDALVEEIVGKIANSASAGDSASASKGNIVVVTVEDWISVRGREPRFAPAVAA